MKKRILFFGKIAVSVLLLALLFSRINFRDLLERYADIRLGFMLLGLFILSTQALLSSIKWKVILRSDGSNIPFLFLWKTYLIGNFLSLFLPSSIGGDFYRIAVVKNASNSLGKSTSSVVFDRVTGVFALLSIAFIASLFLPGSRYNVAAVVLYLALIVAFMILTSDRALARLEPLNKGVTRFAFKLLRSFNAYRKDRRGLLLALLISFLFQFNIVLINKFYTLALNIPIPLAQLMVIIPLIYLTEVLPISINGFGVRESAFAFFFVLIGRTREEGLAVSLMAVFLRYAMGMVGGGLLLLDSLRPKPKPVESPSSEPMVARAPNSLE